MTAGDGWHRSRVVSRWEELQADIAQERQLALLEGRRIGHRRAQAAMADRVRAEKRWHAVTATRWRERGSTDDTTDDD